MNLKYKNNQTVKFILPLVTKLPPRTLMNERLVGVYIGDVDRPQWDGNILLAYHVDGTADFSKLDAKICRLPNYRTSYDYMDKRIVVYVLEIPSESINSVEEILDGRYSHISPINKVDITKFWLDITDYKLVDSILNDHSLVNDMWNRWGKNKEDFCLKGEYWYIPEMTEELFNIDEY